MAHRRPVAPVPPPAVLLIVGSGRLLAWHERRWALAPAVREPVAVDLPSTERGGRGKIGQVV